LDRVRLSIRSHSAVPGRRRRHGAAVTLDRVRFGILGPLYVRAGTSEVEIPRGISRRLLAALTVRAPETVSTDALGEALWGDSPPRNPANALQLQISHLRKALAASDDGVLSAIVTRPGGYALDAAPEQIDARRFAALVHEAGEHAGDTTEDVHEALALIDQALSLWRGEPLADLAEASFAAGDVTRLTELRWAATERRHDLLLALGRHGDAVGDIAPLVAQQPFRERLHEQLVLALYRCGRQAEALRAIASARQVLVDELGVDPGTALQELERQILAHDPRLDWEHPPGDDPDVFRGGASVGPGSRDAPLPVPLTPIIGRHTEIARVRDLIRQHRMVTLTGPGGAGKSRLAVEVARPEAAAGPVWFIDLGPVVDDDLVAPTVAAILGIPIAPEDDPVHVVARAVVRDEPLFVFDTCEHVVLGVARLASRILRGSAGARVLATSRRAIGIRGEIAWPVPPLPVAPPTATAAELGSYPSAELFSARAAAVRSGFTVTGSNAADVAAICLALDGLPLAIELAAARADVLTPAAIRARLQDRFDLLVDGERDASPRQQTLRSALDWSFELLTYPQRTFFARLGVFHGSFDLDAATAVAGWGFDNPLSLLADLARQSMVVVLAGDRYRLLDTLRIYALDQLEGPDLEGALTRHATHYVSLAEAAELQVRGAGQLAWLDRLRTEVANFRAAADWSFGAGVSASGARLAGALAWFWILDGMLGEAIRHLERALDTEGLPPLVRAKALWGFGLLNASLGQLERAREAGMESAALGREAGDQASTGCGLNALAVAEWALGDHTAAAKAHDEAIGLFERSGDIWGQALCMVLRARTALDQDDPQGEAMARDALPMAHRSGDRHLIGIALEQIARAQLENGRVEAAIATATDSLIAQESIGYTEGTIAALHLLGEARMIAGQLRTAEDIHVRALGLADRIGHAAAVCEAFEQIARVKAAAADDAAALRLLVVAECERERLLLPVRPGDAAPLRHLQATLEARLPSASAIARDASGLPAETLTAELLTRVVSPSGDL